MGRMADLAAGCRLLAQAQIIGALIQFSDLNFGRDVFIFKLLEESTNLLHLFMAFSVPKLWKR